jgi:hypothetical protein
MLQRHKDIVTYRTALEPCIHITISIEDRKLYITEVIEARKAELSDSSHAFEQTPLAATPRTESNARFEWLQMLEDKMTMVVIM